MQIGKRAGWKRSALNNANKTHYPSKFIFVSVVEKSEIGKVCVSEPCELCDDQKLIERQEGVVLAVASLRHAPEEHRIADSSVWRGDLHDDGFQSAAANLPDNAVGMLHAYLP